MKFVIYLIFVELIYVGENSQLGGKCIVEKFYLTLDVAVGF